MCKNDIIVFDVDGTLFDTKLGISKAINYALDKLEYPMIEYDSIDKYIGPPVKESFIRFHNMKEEDADKATSIYREIYILEYIKYSELYDGIIELLEYLKSKDCTICIATMKTQEQIDKLLEIKDMKKYFNVVIGAKKDGSLTKSNMLDMISKKFCNSNSKYMIGDTISDYKASEKSGFDFIGVIYGYGQFEGMKDIKLFDGVKELTIYLSDISYL